MLVGVLGWSAEAGHTGPLLVDQPVTFPPHATTGALQLLARWDRRRASAYAHADPRELRHLYSPGSRAGARDVRMLRKYAERGLAVEGLTMQRYDAVLLHRSPTRLELRVRERLRSAEVRSDDGRRDLPASHFTERVLALVRGPDGWVVRSVRRT